MSAHSSAGHSNSSVKIDLQTITDRLAELETTVEHLQAENERLREQLAEKHAQLDAYEARLDDLEARQHVELRDVDDDADAALENIWIAGQPVGRLLDSSCKRSKSLSTRVDDLEAVDPEQLTEDLRQEQITRTKADAQIRARLSQCEDDLGIQKPDALSTEQGGEDAQHLSKLERFIRHGAEAVVDRVYPVHERAREIALHFGEWGTKISDANGKRVRLCSKKDKLKTHLEAAFGQRFQWVEVYRAIEKLAELAHGSPLQCKRGQQSEGKYVLELRLSEGRGPSFARGDGA
ncbi:hypothetical protein [Halegenticoccus tardaugens]|uniref:hypothetical protein n=1 Tax=Halegenticoccus tardaugens TaxID=2071624 RepID=UPI00100C0C17|nr:hypothetical protein [Halegenticoccus tardaugens]